MKIALMAVVLAPMLSGGPPPTSVQYHAALERYVDADGLVDYASLKAQTGANFAEMVSGKWPTDPMPDSWTDPEKIAFWINAYNMFTLKLIVDNYPIKPSEGKTRYPVNSIRQIPDAWEHHKFKALGREVTLDEIEHKILRVDFKEPRIHMALVCGAMSCPKLRREPYTGEKLDAQLDDQAREFLSDLRKFHIDREAGEVWASPIFDWFMDDFLPDASKNYPRHVAAQKSLAVFASQYVSAEDAKYLQEGKYVLKYFEYDWTLNEQPK